MTVYSGCTGSKYTKKTFLMLCRLRYFNSIRKMTKIGIEDLADVIKATFF